MSQSLQVSFDDIQRKIYTVRGVQVMLDKDLALFYEVKPTRLREQVKRNHKRFPDDFMFQLTEEEVDFMVSQNAIPSKQHLGGFLPYVFSEQGVASISSVLTSARAIEVNVQIMRAFVAMRRFISSNAQIFHRLDCVEKKQIENKVDADGKFDQIFNALERGEVPPQQGVFFEGQVFDAYQFVSGLIRSAKRSITLIDNFVDDSVLTLFLKRKKGVSFTIMTKNVSRRLALDVNKFNEQYPLVTIKKFGNSHDRFLIIDDEEVYHIGASLKDLGKRWFAFSKLELGAIEMLLRLKDEDVAD